MSLGTSNRDGGKTSESGHLRALYKGYDGEVLGGLAVSQRGAGANMSVDIAIGDAIIPRSDATYGHPSFNDAVQNKTITTADPSNPRRDIVVMYIDYTVTPSTGVSNNTNGVVATKVVAGTPAGSPSDPSDATIQSSVGASNPYIKLARVRVGAGVTSIGNSVIDDLRTFAHANQSGGWKPLASAWDTVTYSAWDSTNKLATLVVPDSSIFTLGQKFRYWQTTGGWKYGFIVKLPTSTSIILYQGTDYTLNNERVYLPGYSRAKAPDGFPIDPAKWTVSLTSSSDRSTTSASYASLVDTYAAPMGVWDLVWKLAAESFQASTNTLRNYLTLSSNGTSETNPETTLMIQSRDASSAATSSAGASLTSRSRLALTANTTFTMMGKVTGGTIQVLGSAAMPVRVDLTCAYL